MQICALSDTTDAESKAEKHNFKNKMATSAADHQLKVPLSLTES